MSVIEFDALEYLRAEQAGRSYIDARQYVSRFLELFLQEQSFRALVWIESPQPWWKALLGAESTSGRIVTSLEAARRSKDDLARGCMRGWQLLFGLNRGLQGMTEFLDSAQYRMVAKSEIGSGEPGDILLHFPNPGLVKECLQSLQVQSSQTVVLFAHDADPVFLIAQQRS